MKAIAAVIFFFIWVPLCASSEENAQIFEDQEQYELFYEFVYRSNVVESFILECTGERSVSFKFAFATAPISNAFKREILGLKELAPDPFTNKELSARLWDEIKLAVKRNPDDAGAVAEPVLMAQIVTLRQFDAFKEEQDVLCDFLFWEEVSLFESVTASLIRDTKDRKKGTPQLQEFESAVHEGSATLHRLFAANPLKPL